MVKQVQVPDLTVNGTSYRGVTISRVWYGDGTTALVADQAEGPLARLTVNLGAYGLFPVDGGVFLDLNNCGEGIAQELVRVGVVTLTGRTEWYGFGCQAVEAVLAEKLQ